MNSRNHQAERKSHKTHHTVREYTYQFPVLTTLQERDINSHNSPHYKTVMNSHNSPHYQAQMNWHKLTTLSVSTCIISHNSSQDRNINSWYSPHYMTKSHKFTQITTLLGRNEFTQVCYLVREYIHVLIPTTHHTTRQRHKFPQLTTLPERHKFPQLTTLQDSPHNQTETWIPTTHHITRQRHIFPQLTTLQDSDVNFHNSPHCKTETW